jgi:hypothetical protein
MSWWMKRARALQDSVRYGECAKTQEYSDDQVAQAAVHQREDTVLLVGLADATNQHLSEIKWLLLVIVGLLGWLVFKLG